MHYLFNGDDVLLLNQGAKSHPYKDVINHVFTSPNFTDKDELAVSVYLIEDDNSEDVKEWTLYGDFERRAFYEKVPYDDIIRSFGVIIDISNGFNRIVFTWQAGILKKLLVSVCAAHSLAFASEDIALIPQLKINLYRSFHIHITTRLIPYTYQLTNVHPFQVETFHMLRDLIKETASVEKARRWYRRHLIYCRTMDSLLTKVETAGDFINMNPYLIDQYQEDVDLILDSNHLKERLFADNEMDAFLINLEHFTKEYDRIIDRGLNRIKEL